MRAVCAVMLLATLGVTAAHARSDANGLIRPGVGIGKVRLGMTEAQVRAVLGPPGATLRVRRSFGRAELELQYGVDAYLVRLAGIGGRPFRVVEVGTTLRRERTREGLGAGSLEREVVRTYGSRVRCEPLRTGFVPGITTRVLLTQTRECVLAADGGATVFFSSVVPVDAWERIAAEDWRPRARVYAVAVRR